MNSEAQIKDRRKQLSVVIVGLILAAFACVCYLSVYKQKSESSAVILSKINEMQAMYFEIVKRNDILLRLDLSEVQLSKDVKDLHKLFENVENLIAKDNHYLKKYHAIKKQYLVNPGLTTLDMVEYANIQYTAIDNLLNEIYQKIKRILSREDFKLLESSELKWLKEVDNYKKVFDQQGYGSIGPGICIGYQSDMKLFRALLLMLYL